jgi:hypothetical protein
MLKSLVEYFVSSNLPISQVDAPFFQNVGSCIYRSIASDLPNSYKPRSAIIHRAVALHNCIGAATSGSQFGA